MGIWEFSRLASSSVLPSLLSAQLSRSPTRLDLPKNDILETTISFNVSLAVDSLFSTFYSIKLKVITSSYDLSPPLNFLPDPLVSRLDQPSHYRLRPTNTTFTLANSYYPEILRP